MLSPSQPNPVPASRGSSESVDLPSEVQESLGTLRCCVATMYILALLRLVFESYYLFGALIELVVALIGTTVLLDDSVTARYLKPCLSKLPEIKPIPRGLQALRILIFGCIVGVILEFRHTLYMSSANATNLQITLPVVVYGNALLYFTGIMLAVKLQCSSFNNHRGDQYASTGVANAFVGHADTLSDGDDEMRRAIEESQRINMAGMSGAERRAALGVNQPLSRLVQESERQQVTGSGWERAPLPGPMNEQQNRPVNQPAPGGLVNQAAPGRVNEQQDRNRLVNQAAPGLVNQAAPGLVNQAAPGLVNQAAPGTVNEQQDRIVDGGHDNPEEIPSLGSAANRLDSEDELIQRTIEESQQQHMGEALVPSSAPPMQRNSQDDAAKQEEAPSSAPAVQTNSQDDVPKQEEARSAPEANADAKIPQQQQDAGASGPASTETPGTNAEEQERLAQQGVDRAEQERLAQQAALRQQMEEARLRRQNEYKAATGNS